MSRYLAARLASFVPVILGASILVFLMLYLVPGAPVLVPVRHAPVAADGLLCVPAIGEGGIGRRVLPALTVRWFAAGVIAGLVRSGMLEVLRQQYVVKARATGLRQRPVV